MEEMEEGNQKWVVQTTGKLAKILGKVRNQQSRESEVNVGKMVISGQNGTK